MFSLPDAQNLIKYYGLCWDEEDEIGILMEKLEDNLLNFINNKRIQNI